MTQFPIFPSCLPMSDIWVVRPSIITVPNRTWSFTVLIFGRNNHGLCDCFAICSCYWVFASFKGPLPSYMSLWIIETWAPASSKKAVENLSLTNISRLWWQQAAGMAASPTVGPAQPWSLSWEGDLEEWGWGSCWLGLLDILHWHLFSC